jgi:3-hydroxyisobutyrate dehydrogenase-like beta-hydroxyacid dehydrogenase
VSEVGYRVALIGLGEVGRVLAEDLAAAEIVAWDVAIADRESRASVNAKVLGVRVAANAAGAVADAHVVFSAVTAASDVAAARAAATATPPGCWFVDLNSASPNQKQLAAAVIEEAGGRYVEAAVMAPIARRRLGAPMLLGGPYASDFLRHASALGLTGAQHYSDVVGPAAATKLCRSVVIKGLEALLTESMMTARAWNVEQGVLASLSDLMPRVDWPEHAAYMIRRALEHGVRRAEEMREAAAMVDACDVDPVMSTATACVQSWAGHNADALRAADLAGLLDLLRTKRRDAPDTTTSGRRNA